MKVTRNFASDNNAGVHPQILQAIRSVNLGHTVAYGDDPYTEAAVLKFREHFGENIAVYFVFGGTGANVLGIKTVTQPYNAIICAETAHINVDECGAPENFTGCKLLTVATRDGKITLEQIKSHLHGIGNEHHIQPKVISISQTTEMGTVYTPREIEAIAHYAHRHGLLLHVDGARIANAAASLNVSLKELTARVGVDILSFGGTKNGMMYGEAVIFFDQNLSKDFKYIRKQGMHLASKMRFISAQFEALLSNDLWLSSATHANRMAQLLAAGIEGISEIKITQKVEANAVFAVIPEKYIPVLQKKYFFYVWNEEISEVRLMTSFDTTEEDIKNLVDDIKSVVK